MASITNANLNWNDSGAPISTQFGDIYFSNLDGLAETHYVFLHQNHLPSRWPDSTERRFTIGETGFGTGLNFLATCQLFDEFRCKYPDSPLKELHFISFEKYPIQIDDLIKAHKAWPQLSTFAKELQRYYPIAVPGCHRVILADGSITLDLWFGDIKECMPQVPFSEHGIIDAWFLDGFAPSKNPDMWNQDLFNNMAKLGKKNSTCATFTAAGFVRRGLIDAGFDMQKSKGFGIKRDMLIGTLSHKKSLSNMLPWFKLYSTPKLNDVAIIGGGIASACLAKSLARRGIKVTLYCKDSTPANGASGNKQGAIYPLLTKEHDEISRIFPNAFLFTRQQVNQAAIHLNFDYDWCGVTQLMWDEKSTTKLNHLSNAHFHPDLVIKQNQEQTKKNVGLDTEMNSLFYPLGGWLSPAQFTSQLLLDLQNKDQITANYEYEVTQLKWKENRWNLTINNDDVFTHQCVVVANGHQFDQLNPTQELPLSKVKGQVSHIPTTDILSKITSVLCYDGYMTPQNMETHSHCIGASYNKNDLNTQFDSNEQMENKEKLVHCLKNQDWPQEVNISQNESKQGIRCVSRDHLPFVGNLTNIETVKSQYRDLVTKNKNTAEDITCFPNIYAFLGLGSRGLSTAPLLGEYLASLMIGEALPLPVDLTEKLHPTRMWIRKLRKGKKI